MSLLVKPGFNFPPPFPNPRPVIRARITNSSSSTEIEIRVCTHRTCRKQGSSLIHETLAGIAPPEVSVATCGCLGRCGSGPNLVALPSAVFVSHCGTPARAADFLIGLCGGRNTGDGGAGEEKSDASKCLEALALRKRAEVELDRGNLVEAESLLSKAIDIKPFGGLHVILRTRCSVRLQNDNLQGALDDAEQALKLAPRYAEAYICQGDVFFRMSLFDKAEYSYSMALEKDPSICRSRSFKARVAKLQEKLTWTATP